MFERMGSEWRCYGWKVERELTAIRKQRFTPRHRRYKVLPASKFFSLPLDAMSLLVWHFSAVLVSDVVASVNCGNLCNAL